MTNETVTFKGKVRWASVPPNPARKPYEIDSSEPDNCSYSIEVECSKEQFKDLQKKGIPRLTSLREDEDGTTYIRLKSSKIKGKYTFPDPTVIDVNGEKLEKKIANGSEAIVKAELAPIKGRKGVALRLRAVMVTKLIEFANNSDDVNDLISMASPSVLEESYAQDQHPQETPFDTNEDW
jgi:hypothetical protein